MKKLVIGIVLLNLLAACASEPPKDSNIVAEPDYSAIRGAPASSSTAEPVTTSVEESDPLNDTNNILAKRSVYYPFDVSAVQDGDKPVVQAHAAYLSGHPARTVRLEGNADERGSNEYNLALGQRRADGVKKMLVLGGARGSQVETASYGEERPAASGHNESSWSQNRRTDIKY